MNKFLFFVISFLFVCSAQAQQTQAFADSIRQHYNIPELGYAVVSATDVYELQTLGYKKINTLLAADVNDRFRIGSNTKAITGFIAAQLVNEKKISWNTRFFDLFPELRSKRNAAYHHVTLLNLLSFRAGLYSYTYTYDEPKQNQFTGNESEQRYQFTKWFFTKAPVGLKDSLQYSNLGYIAAGLMLEKVAGKPYKQLVTELGQQLEISFDFGAPNSTDTLQPWGHTKDLQPEQPADNFKLNWLLAAGNINVSLPGYVKFIQLQLSGLQGKSTLLSKADFNFLHYGLPTFAVGWFWDTDDNNRLYSFNTGNPGSFLSKVYVYKNSDKAIMLFSNAQTKEAEAGLDALFEKLYSTYIH